MAWPLPGPVVGMLLLFLGLMWRGEVPENLSSTSSVLLGQLSLFFVPAGVGVMTHLTLLGNQWLPLTASLIVSTLLTIAVTGLLMQRLTLTVCTFVLARWLYRRTGQRPWLLERLGVGDPMAKGLALGVASHGIGTGRPVYMGEVAAAFSGLAMGLNGLATAVLLPVLWGWFSN